MGVDELSKQAVHIIRDAYQERKSESLDYDRNTLARLYDSSYQIITGCLYIPGFQMGSLAARKIIRAHIAHLQAKQKGERLTHLSPADKYKGTREF